MPKTVEESIASFKRMADKRWKEGNELFEKGCVEAAKMNWGLAMQYDQQVVLLKHGLSVQLKA